MQRDAPNTSSLDNAIVAHMAEAVIFANREGLIERWNLAAAQMFGASADDAVGQSLDLIIPEPLRAAHWRGFHAAMNHSALRLNGQPTLTRGLHPSGRKLYIEMSFALVRDEADHVVGSVAVARDVTERVEREKAVRTAAAATAK